MNYKILRAATADGLEEAVNETLNDLHAGTELHPGEKWEVIGGPIVDVGPNRTGSWYQAIRFEKLSGFGGQV